MEKLVKKTGLGIDSDKENATFVFTNTYNSYYQDENGDKYYFEVDIDDEKWITQVYEDSHIENVDWSVDFVEEHDENYYKFTLSC